MNATPAAVFFVFVFHDYLSKLFYDLCWSYESKGVFGVACVYREKDLFKSAF